MIQNSLKHTLMGETVREDPTIIWGHGAHRRQELLPEMWELFSLGSLWAVLRFAVRIRTFGIYGLGSDDGFAFIALLSWAVIIAGINATYYTTTNIDYEPDEVWALTAQEVKRPEWGSKFYIITFYA